MPSSLPFSHSGPGYPDHCITTVPGSAVSWQRVCGVPLAFICPMFLESFWNLLGISMESGLNLYGISLKSFWNFKEISLESVWDFIGISFESL